MSVPTASVGSAVGFAPMSPGAAWERTPWHATQRAAWEVFDRYNIASETDLRQAADRLAAYVGSVGASASILAYSSSTTYLRGYMEPGKKHSQVHHNAGRAFARCAVNAMSTAQTEVARRTWWKK